MRSDRASRTSNDNSFASTRFAYFLQAKVRCVTETKKKHTKYHNEYLLFTYCLFSTYPGIPSIPNASDTGCGLMSGNRYNGKNPILGGLLGLQTVWVRHPKEPAT